MPDPGVIPLPTGLAGRNGTVGLPASGGGFGGGTAPLSGLVGGGGGGTLVLAAGGGGVGGVIALGGGLIPDGSDLGGRVMRIVSFLESSSCAFEGISSAINIGWRVGFYLSRVVPCQPVYAIGNASMQPTKRLRDQKHRAFQAHRLPLSEKQLLRNLHRPGRCRAQRRIFKQRDCRVALFTVIHHRWRIAFGE